MSELSDQQHKLANAVDEVANLDILRSIAVLSVFFDHLRNFMRPGTYSNMGWHFAQMGVLAFFVHTSLVLMYSLERQRNAGQPIFAPFYIRRWFRIYPLSIFFVVVVYLWSFGIKDWTLGDIVANITLTQNVFRRENMLNVLWTLPLEVQMYVLLPFLFVFLQRRSWTWAVAVFALSLPIAFWQLQATDRLSILGYIPCFMGGLLAHAADAIKWGIFIGLTFIVPVMAYHLLEEPMINVGKWLVRRWSLVFSRHRTV